MITIHKYPTSIEDQFFIKMPDGAEILTVQQQAGGPCIWAKVDTSKPVRDRLFHWRGTGYDASNLGRYVGTIQELGLVFHLFEGRES